jgi:hypothetical protein
MYSSRYMEVIFYSVCCCNITKHRVKTASLISYVAVRRIRFPFRPSSRESIKYQFSLTVSMTGKYEPFRTCTFLSNKRGQLVPMTKVRAPQNLALILSSMGVAALGKWVRYADKLFPLASRQTDSRIRP